APPAVLNRARGRPSRHTNQIRMVVLLLRCARTARSLLRRRDACAPVRDAPNARMSRRVRFGQELQETPASMVELVVSGASYGCARRRAPADKWRRGVFKGVSVAVDSIRHRETG